MKWLTPWLVCLAIGCTGNTSEIFETFPDSDDAGVPERDPGPARRAPVPPPPIAGGTLEVDPASRRAVVSDPDRGRVSVIDLEVPVPGGVILATHRADEPGRVALGAERAYVALRHGGVLALDLESGALLDRFDPCPGPRGLAVDADALHVACLGGALLRLDPRTGAEIERIWLPPDLRDVVLVGDTRWVSRFRTAEVIVITADGARHPLRVPERADEGPWLARVAWRMRAMPDGRVGLLHQWHRVGELAGDGYGHSDQGWVAECNRVAAVPGLTVFGADGRVERSHGIAGVSYAVDFAANGAEIALATPGELEPYDPWATRERRIRMGFQPLRKVTLPDRDPQACLPVSAGGQGADRTVGVAVAQGRALYHSREPARLQWYAGGPTIATVEPHPPSVVDTGHDLFHIDAGGGIACVHCHPEGADDGHAWLLDDRGARRTQSLVGGLADTAPLHWSGEFADFGALFDAVMSDRMRGPRVEGEHLDLFVAWLDAIRAPRFAANLDRQAVARGARVFVSAGCGDCHSGAQFSDGAAHDVGTGGRFETPRLPGMYLRGTLMHDGCADGIAGRFDAACGGGDDHGRVDDLSEDEKADLIEFLRSL